MAAASLLLPGPVVAVASDGPWVAVAQGRSTYDCDRISIWNTHRTVFRLGRKTSCSASGGKIVTVSEIDNRAVWLHADGGSPSVWTLWTASTTTRFPRLIARATRAGNEPPPIALGPGNEDRGQLTFGGGDVLPYAVGQEVAVLRTNGSRAFTWTAPSRVTALGSSPGLLVVAVEDGQIFLFERDSSWGLIYTWPGSVAATRAFWDGIDVVAQRTGRVERLSLKPRGSHGCSATRALGAREELAAASGGREVLARGSHFRVLPGCGGKAVATGMASAVALDGDRLTTASGRRITTRFLPQP